MLEDLLLKIEEFDNIIIHRHQRPDGDAIGSQMGLKQFIIDNFPDKHVYAVGEMGPEYLESIATMDEVPDDLYKESLVIVLDTSNETRISDQRFSTGKYIYKIDHHDDSPDFGNAQYVDATCPACAAIITSAIKSWTKYTLSKKAAFYLYFGITTDTGRFRYRGVGEEVFSDAAFLVSTGLDIETIYDILYVDDPKVLKLQGYVYSHFKQTKNGVVYIHFTKQMMKRFGVAKDDASNLVNVLGSIKGAPIWVAFIDQLKPFKFSDIYNKEAPYKEIRARIRSRHITINDIAKDYRGGGHLCAAGATVFSIKEMKNLLHDLDTKLCQFKKENPDVQ